MIDLMKLSGLFQQSGFKGVTLSADYKGIPFHLVAEGKIGLQKMPVLVRAFDRFGLENVEQTVKDFATLSRESVSMVLGKFFLFCVIADTVDPNAVVHLFKTTGEAQEDAKGLLKEGGGGLIVAIVASKEIIPERSRWNTTRFENKARDVIKQAM